LRRVVLMVRNSVRLQDRPGASSFGFDIGEVSRQVCGGSALAVSYHIGGCFVKVVGDGMG
jgi:hypothetical protein